MDEILKFKHVRDDVVSVEIWGDFLEPQGNMDIETMAPFVNNLKPRRFDATGNLVPITGEEVIKELRTGKDFDLVIPKRKSR